MDVTRAVFMCVVLCSAVRADISNGDVAVGEEIAHDEPKAPRASHRLQLLFPLLLRISMRLATLIPTAIAGLFGIFLFVAFSKKAFLISLLALFLTYLDKYKRDEDVVHIHKINLYNDEEVLTHNEEHLHYGWADRQQFFGSYPYRRWPYYAYPYFSRPPAALEGLRRTSNYTVPTDFNEFLSQSVDSPAIRGHRRRKRP